MNGTNRTCLTPREAKLLVRYLDGVDDAVTARLSSGFSPHEDHLTSLICEMLDDNLTALNRLSFPLTELQAELAKDPRKLKAAFSIETRKYPPHIERRLTSSDIGMIVSYRDHLVPSHSFETGALFQAKRLFPSQRRGESAYSLADRFESFETEQLVRIAILDRDAGHPEMHRHRMGHGGLCHYLFYCPRPEAYDERSREEIHRYLVPSGNIFDYAMGWHLYELASDPERHTPGLIATGIHWLGNTYLEWSDQRVPSIRDKKGKPSARDVFQQMWQEAFPLSWFLVYGMLLDHRGSSSPDHLALVRGQTTAQDTDTPLLPRYVVTVRVEAGTERG
ncbi:MAG: hypothetical protein AB7K71_28285 [Polyangiaceae bacterium]